MQIRDVVTTCVAECTEDTSLTEVYELLQKCEHGFVVVLDSPTHRVPLGIVTEHTICENLISRGRRPKELQAGSVMNTRVRRVPAATPVASCTEMLRSAVSDPILVVDEKRQFCGLVSREAIAAAARSVAASPVFTPAAALPARTEIPAFGWLS
jgi:CBS-domain-containing membrane protein